MRGLETPKDETLTTPHPCSCLSPVSTLIPGKFHIPSSTPGSICSHALWPAPPAPLGSWCPESGNFPGLGEIRVALPSHFDRRPDGSAGSVVGEAAAATGGRPREERGAWYQSPGGATSRCHHSNRHPALQTGSCSCMDSGMGRRSGDPAPFIFQGKWSRGWGLVWVTNRQSS